jgi:hypothetical protein
MLVLRGLNALIKRLSSVRPTDTKAELSAVERIAIPGLLVGIMYSAYSTALTGIHYLNDVRNTIFQIALPMPSTTTKLPREFAAMLFHDDWIPLWIGNTVYMGVVAMVILLVPFFLMKVRHIEPHVQLGIWILAGSCFLLPFAGFICNVYSGIFDIRDIHHFIESLPKLDASPSSGAPTTTG